MASRQELLTRASGLEIVICDFEGFFTDGRLDGWTEGWMDKRPKAWTNGQADRLFIEI